MTKKNNPTSRTSDLIEQELKDELLIYDLKTNKAYCLNSTAAIVYRLCNGSNSFSDIDQELSKKLKEPFNEYMTWLALDQLKNLGLLSTEENIEDTFKGLSRRQIIRKVGFATFAALPLISSLVAPTATQAASGPATCANPSLTSCTTDNDCILNDPNGADTCGNNCCVFGPGIPGGGGCPPGQIFC